MIEKGNSCPVVVATAGKDEPILFKTVVASSCVRCAREDNHRQAYIRHDWRDVSADDSFDSLQQHSPRLPTSYKSSTRTTKATANTQQNCPLRRIHSSSFSTMTDTLEQRIAALEQGATFQATQTAIREREAEMLNTLREIREQMAKEAASGATASSGEVTELKQENARLQALVAKQEYRIRHLISNMEEMMAKK
eukprot:Nitzschia sp. Nitz4//scaffold13_size275219//194047//194784//NITZ4_000896-RA/size275219-snap-gene-0.58-mRNA-1//-1//CDS//3329536080//7237//frame0